LPILDDDDEGVGDSSLALGIDDADGNALRDGRLRLESE
jgi:hypothetical protein